MKQKLNLSYEMVNGFSYLTIRLSPKAELVNYQLAMMMDNEIKGFLPAFKRVMNGEMVLYYNITSKIPLNQLLEKRKLKREEFLCLTEGILSAMKDAADYRLPESGLMLDPEYLYVNPSNCEPGMIFLPVSGLEGISLRTFLQDLVIHGRLELSSDNFIQVLLNALNEEPFSVKRLETCIHSFDSFGKKETVNSAAFGNQRQKETQGVISSQENHRNGLGEGRTPVSELGRETDNRSSQAFSGSRGESVGMNVNAGREAGLAELEPSKKSRPTLKREKTEERKSEKIAEKQPEASDNKKGKVKFLLAQPVFLALVAAAVVSGLFVDESGKLVLNYVLAIGLAVAVLEFVLYREIFVNKKENKKEAVSGKKTKKKAEGKKQTKKVKTTKPDKKNTKRPGLSGQSAPSLEKVPQPEASAEFSAQKNAQPEMVALSTSRPQADPDANGFMPENRFLEEKHSVQKEDWNGLNWSNRSMSDVALPTKSFGAGSEDTVLAEETELWSGDGEMGQRAPAYLEFFENGSVSRIPLGKPEGVLIGRLRSQADFVVTNARVGKVHAKFFADNGQYFVVDINSKNGTFINGSSQRITSNVPYPLHDNDRITLADSEFTLRCPQG